MATIAEIAKNPAVRPVKAIDQLAKQGHSPDVIARMINEKLRAAGEKKYQLTAASVRSYLGIHTAGPKVVYKKHKKSGMRVPVTLSTEQVLALRQKASARAKARRSEIQSTGFEGLEQAYARRAGKGGVPHITSKVRERLQTEAYLRGQLNALKSKLGMKSKAASKRQDYITSRLALPTIGSQVGKYANRRRVGGMVAMNPAFGNPSFNFTKEAIMGNVVSGGQTALGVVAGVAAAKYGNDLVVEKIMQSVFKKQAGDKLSIWQRLATAAITGVVVPGMARSFLPREEWVDRVADGMVAGSALYVLGGIEYQGKPVINVGQMIGASDDVVIDRSVQASENIPGVQAYGSERYVIDSPVSAYDQNEDREYVEGNDTMTDNLVGGDYDLTENPELR